MPIASALREKFAQQLRPFAAPLRVRFWDGEAIDFAPDPRVTLTVKSPGALGRLAQPTLQGLGEAYVEGEIDLEGSIWEALAIAEAITGTGPQRPPRWRSRWRTRRADAEAIRYHYDVSNEFYALWLDREMIYSCAYFKTGREDIHQAQAQKLDHICRKLMLKPGDRFLDIGCGWGGLICWAAKHYGVDATGITLSQSQWELAQARIREAGLEGRCRALLCDYRDLVDREGFDKVASVGMFEHVGLKNLPAYFGAARRLLKEDGLMLNHGITLPEAAQGGKGLEGGDFIERYVFPLGELPGLGLVVQEMARQDLEVVDVESLRPHYAQTLAHWVARLEANRPRAEALAGERRYRIWQVYMAACVRNFERGGVSIHQVLASRKVQPGPAALPWTREHLYVPGADVTAARLRIPAAVAP